MITIPEHDPAQGLAIEIQDLSKLYAATAKTDAKLALDRVNLRIPKGSIYGLLGPNGAGKSTLINIMAGLILGTSGMVKIWGSEATRDPRGAKSAIGVVPQEINYDPFFTPEQLLDIQAGMYGVPKKERRTAELLEMVGLTAQSKSYTRSLSGGMKRRLMVAKAMVHTPPILVLDEPTAGVDVELRQQLWANVRALNKRGTTILLTTHYLEEAEAMCDRIAIINKGKIMVDDDKDSLLSKIDNKEIHFRLDRAVDGVPEGLKGLLVERRGTNALIVRYNPAEHDAGKIIAAIQQGGYGINDLSTKQSALEDIFMTMTRG